MNNKAWESSIFTCIFTFLFLSLAFFIQDENEMINMNIIMALVAYILFINPLILISSFFLFTQIRSNNSNTVDKILIDMIKTEEIKQGIYFQQYVYEFEKKHSFEEIWVISSDLYFEDRYNKKEKERTVFKGVVQANLEKKNPVKYSYFIPNKKEIIDRFEYLKKKYNYNSNFNGYICNNDELYFLIKNMDIILYDPQKTDSEGCRGFMYLPIDGVEEGLVIAAEMNFDFIQRVFTKFKEVKANSDNMINKYLNFY